MPIATGEAAPATTETVELIKGRLTQYRRRGSTNTRGIVFVHGIKGDPFTTWRNGADAPVGFIDLILQDDDLQDYDVFSFGYRSTLPRGAPIGNAALQLRSAMSAVQQRCSSIVLIAHSMGGLVSMKYIVDQLQQSVTPPIGGLMLFGTPTTGSDLVNIAKLVSYGIGLKIPGVATVMNLFLRGQRQLTDLATGSEFLTRLHTEWAFRVVNGGHEKAGTQRMWLAVRAVSGEDDIAVKEASAKGVYGAIDWMPLPYGHIQLVKPAEVNDERFLVAKDFLQISRRTDPAILDRVWKAAQQIWSTRSSRVSRRLIFSTSIDQNDHPSGGGTPLTEYGTCHTSCAYDVVLEKDHVEFGASFGPTDFWNRSSPPVYVHQIGLDLLPKTERNALRSHLDSTLDEDGGNSEEEIWRFFFPEMSLEIDGVRIDEGEFIWPEGRRKYANWLLRKFALPRQLASKLGSSVRLTIKYRSIVPSSLPHFAFSAPWIVHGADINVVIEGDFEYFVPIPRLVPSGRVNITPGEFDTRREVGFSYDGIMLPGSAMEVRWRLRS
jgi:pimeloyl-ACP methyl ester carboxylesterase